MPISERNIIIFVVIITLYLIEPRYFAAAYTNRRPLISSATLALNNSAEFVQLVGFPYEVIKAKYYNIICPMLRYTTASIKEWLFGGRLRIANTGRSHKLDSENRCLLSLMVLRHYNVKMLQLTFGIAKSIIYSDAYLIYSIFIALRGHELNLPHVGSQECDELVGAGIFEGIFDETVYIMDGHKGNNETILCFFEHVSETMKQSSDFLNFYSGQYI